MVVILILGVLWGVVLAPAAVRRFKSQASHQSIDSFHHSLHLLEHSGPKIVEPAYRLVGDGGPGQGAPRLRPRLVLLRPMGQGEETDMGSYFDDRYEDEHDDDPSVFDRSYDEWHRDLDGRVQARRAAARRRRNLLAGLVGAVVAFAVLSLVVSFFMVFAAIAAIALVAYVSLMAYAALSLDVGRGDRADVGGGERHVAHAVAWDDEPSWSDEDEGWAQSDDDWWEPRTAVGR